jgi:hypothetical protein
VEAGDTGAVALLAEYAATEQKPDLAQTALASLRSVRHQRAIHQVCQVWMDLRKRGEAYPAQVLESLIRERRWVASQPTDLRVYTALLNEVNDSVNLARPEVVRILLQICHADDPVLSPRAMRLLERLKEPAAIDALCDAFIERDDALARSLILQHDYLPSDATRQALVLFLTEQFDRYEALDPDHALLSAAYLAAPPTLQQRLLEHARRTGRADLMRLLTGGDLRRRARDLTEREWHTVLEMLTRQQRWGDLWRLALHAPPRWAWQLLQRLAVVRWDARALPEEEWRLFETLASLCDPPQAPKPTAAARRHADRMAHACVAGRGAGTRHRLQPRRQVANCGTLEAASRSTNSTQGGACASLRYPTACVVYVRTPSIRCWSRRMPSIYTFSRCPNCTFGNARRRSP